jgi:1-deoxy-D-xylulose-5-phosphate reductoisomerase
MDGVTQRRSVTILGATGSVGRSTLDLIGRDPDRFEIIALTARKDIDGLIELARRFQPGRR